MSNRTDIVVETDNAEGQVLLSASRVYDLTEVKTQDTINSEVRNTLTQLGNDIATILQDPAQDTFTEGTYVIYNNLLYTVAVNSGGIPAGTPASTYYPSKLTAVPNGGLNDARDGAIATINGSLGKLKNIYRFTIAAGNVAAGASPAISTDYASDSLVYVDGGKIRFSSDVTALIAFHIAGKTATLDRVFFGIRGTNIESKYIQYGEYYSVDGIVVSLCSPSLPVYFTFDEAANIGGGGFGNAYIYVVILSKNS